MTVARKAEFQETLEGCFTDLIYSVIIMLRQQNFDGQSHYTNQSGHQIPKIGLRRIRAMELLKTLMSALSKNFNLKNNEKLSEVIRRKILETMLWMIKTYQFCSTSNQLAVQIINFLREAFDEEDMDALKQFVM